MSDVYKQHDAAFAAVSAFVILDKSGERVATVALKFPRDGAGRLYAYVHLIGVEMVRAHAGGYGYDKRSAAVAAAIAKLPAGTVREAGPGEVVDSYVKRRQVNRAKMQAAAPVMDSDDWTRALEKQGFRVLQAV
jgi:hypothetical protein